MAACYAAAFLDQGFPVERIGEVIRFYCGGPGDRALGRNGCSTGQTWSDDDADFVIIDLPIMIASGGMGSIRTVIARGAAATTRAAVVEGTVNVADDAVRSVADDVVRLSVRPPGGAVNYVGGTHNCVSCVIAGDSTLAGRPASALNLYPGRAIPNGMSAIEDYAGAVFRLVSGRAPIESELLGAGNGARGIVYGANEKARKSPTSGMP